MTRVYQGQVKQTYPFLIWVKEAHELLGLGVIQVLVFVDQVRHAAGLLRRSVVSSAIAEYLHSHRRGVDGVNEHLLEVHKLRKVRQPEL